jgi:hypothetical protein
VQWQKHGVGGVFHFLWQNSDTEGTQPPAIYIFSGIDRNSKTFLSWVYRVAPVFGGLYVEVHDPYTQRCTQDALFNSAARYDINVQISVELPKLIEKELDALPFYHFCGLGFVDPSERRGYCFRLPGSGQRDEIFDSLGRLALPLRSLIDANFGMIELRPAGNP